LIIEKIYAEKARKIKNNPCHSNRASNLGDPCLRRLVYERTNWQDKQLYDINTQLIFDEGNNQEKIVIRDLLDAGIEIFEQQRSFEIRDLQISGRMDLKVKVPGDPHLYPAEIKSMSDHIFLKINSINDFYILPYPWLKKYPGQLILYMLDSEEDRGVFILKNKSTGALKEIWIEMDWNLADLLLKKAEEINKHIKAGTYPEKINNLDICNKCPFNHICLPDQSFGPEFSQDQRNQLIDLTARINELKEYYLEYESLNKKLKELLKKWDHSHGIHITNGIKTK